MDRPTPWQLPRLALIAKKAAAGGLAVLAMYQLYVAWKLSNHQDLPDDNIRALLVTPAAVAAIVGLLYFGFVRQARRQEHIIRRQDQLHDLYVQTNVHHARGLARLNQTIIDEFANRADLSTERLVALERVTAALQDRMEARFSVIEAAVDQHVCKGYVDGYGDATAGRPPENVRPKLTRINGYKTS